MENCRKFSKILSSWAVYVFFCLQRVSIHERVEVVDADFVNQLVGYFETCLEKVFKQLKLLAFPVRRGHCFG